MLGLTLAACGCQPLASAVASPTSTLASPAGSGVLTIAVLYPTTGTSVAMGGPMSVIAQAADSLGRPVSGGRATIEVEDSQGRVMLVTSMNPGKDGVYRASSWLVPHRTTAGTWTVRVSVHSGQAMGQAVARFAVTPSLSEELLAKYGFWIDAPVLRGIQPSLVAERGDARNGLIRWGGIIPAAHVFPEAWLEVQWRSGRSALDDPVSVRRFLLDDLGDIGFTPIRAIGSITPFMFQIWPGWKVAMRGQYSYDDIEWVVFYAPQVDRTYAIGTTVVLPPAGVDAHAQLRDSFELPPGVKANGVAPEPLPDLLPGPQLLSPPLGARVVGHATAIMLEWAPVKNLEPDEVYQVAVSYNYDESSYDLSFSTRETRLRLPPDLYLQPNCGVFNWQVRLVRQAEMASGGQPVFEAESYFSLYAYILWTAPPDAPAEFLPRCPNAQY
jgi:hypothetical protein